MKSATLGVMATVTLAIAGCAPETTATSQTELNAQHSSGLAAPATVAPTSTAPKSPRGNLVKEIGQVGGTANEGEDDTSMTFTVDKILIDPKCTDKYAEKPERGHYVAVHMTVKTTPTYDPQASLSSITQHDFDIVTPDGITESEVAGYSSCMKPDEHLTFDRFAPASQYRGVVILDTKHTTGILVLKPAVMTGGWEWQF